MSMNGSDILLLMNTGTEVAPVYEVLGSQRGASFTESTANRDASSKDSRAQMVEPGRYSSTVSGEALYVPTEDGYQALLDAMRDGTKILIRASEDAIEIEQASCVVNTITRNAPDQETALCTFELTVDGDWVELTS